MILRLPHCVRSLRRLRLGLLMAWTERGRRPSRSPPRPGLPLRCAPGTAGTSAKQPFRVGAGLRRFSPCPRKFGSNGRRFPQSPPLQHLCDRHKCSPARARTWDMRVNSAPLYQLSYRGKTALQVFLRRALWRRMITSRDFSAPCLVAQKECSR